jgi:hypothetical protein
MRSVAPRRRGRPGGQLSHPHGIEMPLAIAYGGGEHGDQQRR